MSAPNCLEVPGNQTDRQRVSTSTCSTTSSNRRLFFENLRPLDTTRDPYIRDLNLPVILISGIINVLFGGAVVLMEITGIIIAQIKKNPHMFGASAPGVWIGCFFLFTATVGLLIHRRHKTKKVIPHRLLVVYVASSLLACLISITMISFIAYVMAADGANYRLCFGSQTSCMFDLKVFNMATRACQYCDDSAIHDIYIILLFCMIFAYVVILIFGFATIKITIRWMDLIQKGVLPQRANDAISRWPVTVDAEVSQKVDRF